MWILSPCCSSNSERLTVLPREFHPCSGIPSPPGQAYTWLWLSFLWTSPHLGHTQTCRHLFTAAPGLTLPSRSLCHFINLNSHFLCDIIPSPGIPPSPSPPFLLLCDTPQGQPLLLAQISHTALSSLLVPHDNCAVLLFWLIRKVISLFYPQVSVAQNPQDFSMCMVHVLGQACVTKVPMFPWTPPHLVCFCNSVNGSTVYQLTEPRISHHLVMSPCLLLHQPSTNPTMTLRVYIASCKFAQHFWALRSFRKLRREDPKFRVILDYKMSSTPAWDTWGSLSKINKWLK